MKKLLVVVISLMLCTTCIGDVKRVSANTSFDDISKYELNTMSLTKEQKEVLKKLYKSFNKTVIYSEFRFDENNKLVHQISYEELKEKLKITSYEIYFVKKFVKYYIEKGSNISNKVQIKTAAENFRIDLIYAETKNYLESVTTNFAIAIVGVLVALGATIGGVLGIVVSSQLVYIVQIILSKLQKRH